MSSRPIAVTGIKPSGTPQLGNLLGMIRPALALRERYDAYYFIADEHALTTVADRDELQRLTDEVVATWLALGLDPERDVFYRQSDVPEVFELAWILSCVTPKGLLNRAHAYKAAVDANKATGRTPDDGVSAGLFNYPMLMAADILLFDAAVVPVGADQAQHLEMTRDIAEAFNRTFGDTLTIPEALIDADVAIVPGLDGRKMSKSYGNIIPIFASPDDARKAVMRIVTDSRPPEEPKDPTTCNVFSIYKHVAPPDDVEAMAKRYRAGDVGYGEAKQRLADVLEDQLSAPRRRYEELLADRAAIDAVLAAGAERAHPHARQTLDRAKRAVGLSR